MSYAVYASGKTLEKDYKTLNDEFCKIHNMKFKQEVNIDLINDASEIKEMHHEIYYYPAENNSNAFIQIPCHWDYNHMVQTEKDILSAAVKLGIKITTRRSY
jgi:proteasome assembly chaperone (PAC2) family protein